VTNLPHCSSNIAIRHNDATRRCDGDVTLRRDFALSRHNRQRWPIGRAKFLLALKKAAIQYVESEKNNAVDEDDDIVESRDGDLRMMNSMDAFLSRMNSTIIQWRTYLASLNGDTLVLSNAKVDEFVVMVEHARKIHREGETNDTPTRKRK
jgi:hypothetical protein